MSFITTPHINAEADAFGKTVLMPGIDCVPSLLQRITWRMPSWSIMSEVFRDIQVLIREQKSVLWQVVWVCLPLESILMNYLHSLV